jgi:hypothetical protein
MRFAKAYFDIGLFTNQREAQQQFWSERAGLPFDHTQKLGGGVLQHRYAAGDAVLKLNDSRDPLPDCGAGRVRQILVADARVGQPQDITDPDGNPVRLVPPGFQQIKGLAARISVSNRERSLAFYRDALGLKQLAPDQLSCGEAMLWLDESDTSPATPDQPLAALGVRYLTFQVFDRDGTQPIDISTKAHDNDLQQKHLTSGQTDAG